MLQRFLDALRGEGPILPNSFTLKLGELIREARAEAKLSQSELARRVYLRQSSISNIEKGLRAVSTEELLYLIFALDKPISYFFPKQFTQELAEDELSVLQKELVLQSTRLSKDDLRRLIVQARAIAELKIPSTDATAEDYRKLAELFDFKPAKKRQKTK